MGEYMETQTKEKWEIWIIPETTKNAKRIQYAEQGVRYARRNR
jgi:hypothetical protein